MGEKKVPGIRVLSKAFIVLLLLSIVVSQAQAAGTLTGSVTASPTVIKSGQVSDVTYSLANTNSQQYYVYVESGGRLINMLCQSTATDGTLHTSWNGTYGTGTNVPDGTYTVKLNTTSVTTIISGLNAPCGVAVDDNGNLYFADTSNQAVKKWNSAQGVTTLVSSGLNNPYGVAVDNNGNVYIADRMGNAVRKWNEAEGLTTLVSSGLNYPMGVAVDADGNIYIADTNGNTIKKWSEAQGLTTLVSSGLSLPVGIAFDDAGNLYIADAGNSAVRKWNSTAGLTTVISSGLNCAYSAVPDNNGNLYIADTNNNMLKRWSETQGLTTLVSSGLNFPVGAAVDNNGNVYVSDTMHNTVKEWNSVRVDVGQQVVVDNTAPTVTCALGGTPVNGWYHANVQVTLSATDGGAGISSIRYSLDNVSWYDYVSAFTVSGEGTNMVYWNVTDNAGNSARGSRPIKIDKALPVLQCTVTTLPNENNWYNHDVQVNFTATDATSGVATITPNVTLTRNGPGQEASCTAMDNAGNSNTITISGIDIDKAPPQVTCSLAGTENNTFYTSNVQVTLSVADALSGIGSIRYSLDGVSWTTHSSSSTTLYWSDTDTAGNTDGTSTVYWSCTDNAGNTATGNRAFTVDRAAPATTASLSGISVSGTYVTDVMVTLTAADTCSGVNHTEYTVNNGTWTRYTGPFTLGTSSNVSYRSVDNAGNLETAQTVSFDRFVIPPVILGSGTISMDDLYGRQRTATATVTPTPVVTPVVTPQPAGNTTTATPTPATTPTPAPATTTTASPTTATEQPSGTGYWLWLALLGFAIIIVVGGAYFLFFRK